ncbi:MAG: hypothetical protein WBW38_19505 [Candidatus Sulfotelmatobacter sp.]
MRFKLIALILALTVMSWAQTATPSAPSTPQQSTVPAGAKACPCCDKASAEMKEGDACSAHHATAAKGAKAACCSGKDAKSCKRNSADTTAAACCGGENCGKECGKECAGKQGRKIAGSCSGGCCAGRADNHSSPGASK